MPISQCFLDRPDGRLAYEIHGDPASDGPWVVCVPGMGELRQSYRHLVPLLTRRGYRVVTLDLRGHGGSDATFDAYDGLALAGDLLALGTKLEGPVVLVGSSMAAGAAVIAAAESPTQVSGLALLGPFVRNPPGSRLTTLGMRVAMLRPWGPRAFLGYYARLFPGRKPDGYDEHVAAVRASLRRPAHWRAFVRTTRTSHEHAESRLDQVRAPSVVVMGSDDIDWKNPAEEAAWIAARISADVVVAPDVGHYPHAQAPALTADAISKVVDGAARA